MAARQILDVVLFHFCTYLTVIGGHLPRVQLLGTSKLNGITPFIWLKEILCRIPSHPINKIAALLPQHLN
jgi:hypothetical protein